MAVSAKYRPATATTARIEEAPKIGVGTDRNPSGPYVKIRSRPNWRSRGPAMWSAARHDSSIPIGAASVYGHESTEMMAATSRVAGHPASRAIAPRARRRSSDARSSSEPDPLAEGPPDVDDVPAADVQAAIRLVRRAEDEHVALLEDAVERREALVLDVRVRAEDAGAGPPRAACGACSSATPEGRRTRP